MRFSGLLLLLVIMGCGAATAPVEADQSAVAVTVTDAETTNQSLTNYDLKRLLDLRQRVRSGEASLQKPYRKLIAKGDKLLDQPLTSVMTKTVTPPGGDMHDYVSLAPYWWPDPSKPDGLPWIRRDGEVNPQTKDGNTDDQAKDRAFDLIDDLAWAAFFSGEAKYADRAVEQLNVFFLDEATRMNPNLKYGQGVPGRNDGRCFGIIETAGLQRIVTALELLKLNEQLPAATEAGMRKWLADYTNWLQTSTLGIKEGTRENNHANWYDAQLVSMQRYLGQNDAARERLEAAKANRIATQIKPDGRQPHELGRTKSLSYSAMSLRALTQLAWHGRQLGVDLWNYETTDGRSLPQAYAYLQPFVFGDKKWEYEQLGDMNEKRQETRRMFYRTGAMLGVPEYCALARENDWEPRSVEDFLLSCE